MIAAFALTEPEAGSDAGSLRTAAAPDGDGWSITGSKQWITNGGFGGTVLLFARTDPDTPGPKGVSAFVLDGDQVRVTRVEEKLGLNSSSTVDLAIEGVHVGRDRLLHEEGKGFSVAMATLDGGRIGIGAMALGLVPLVVSAVTLLVKVGSKFYPPGDIAALHLGLEEAQVRVVIAEPYSSSAVVAPGTRAKVEASILALGMR